MLVVRFPGSDKPESVRFETSRNLKPRTTGLDLRAWPSAVFSTALSKYNGSPVNLSSSVTSIPSYSAPLVHSRSRAVEDRLLSNRAFYMLDSPIYKNTKV